MARKITPEQRITIPEKVELTCDRCGATGEDGKGAFRDGTRLRSDWWAMGIDGATGGATTEYDLCGKCLSAFEAWMKREPAKGAAQ